MTKIVGTWNWWGKEHHLLIGCRQKWWLGKMHHILTKYQPHITLHQNNITFPNHSTIPCNHSIIPHNITRYHSTMHCKDIELATEVEEEVEEALEEEEYWWYAINFNNQDTMQENVHFHLWHVCTVVHQTMTQNTVWHYWGRYRTREIKTIRMFNVFLQKWGIMEEIST